MHIRALYHESRHGSPFGLADPHPITPTPCKISTSLPTHPLHSHNFPMNLDLLVLFLVVLIRGTICYKFLNCIVLVKNPLKLSGGRPSINQRGTNNAVCRTALATPGLLLISVYKEPHRHLVGTLPCAMH